MKPHVRIILDHEIISNSFFYINLKDGTNIKVGSQCHRLVENEEFFEDSENEWIPTGNYREIIDVFYLTGQREGYLYYEDDLNNFFDIDGHPKWDHDGSIHDFFHGMTVNQLFNEEKDNNETRQKKWDNHKSKFSRVSSKDQFEVEFL